MRKSIITICFIILGNVCMSQADSVRLVPVIKAAADSMTNAFLKKDFTSFAHFNNTRLLDMLGGETGFVEFLEKQIELLKDVNFTEMKTGRIIRVLAFNGTHQCIIEQQSELSMDGMVISSVSHLVGLSADGGVNWRFADANNGTKEEFASIMPELSPAMIIPKKKQEMGKSLVELLKNYKTEYLP
jgi:hypothetical protein